MAFDVRWHSQQGTRTAENRDYAGIGIRGDQVLAIVRDGSTSGPASGAFSREIACLMVDWFVNMPVAPSTESLTEQLRATHGVLARDFKKDSASYALLYAQPTQPVLVLHAGDCLVRRLDADGRTIWLLQPHTLANALAFNEIENLAKDAARHVLARSFRSRGFIAPDLSLIELNDQPLLVATDGFWAELNVDEQRAFVTGYVDEGERDDRSVLMISRKEEGSKSAVTGEPSPQNLYLRERLTPKILDDGNLSNG